MGTHDTKASEAAAPDANLLENTGDESLFDGLMGAIGNDGYFQKRFNLIFNFLLVALMTMPYLNLVLAMTVPGHHCHVPGRNASQHTLTQWHNHTLPMEKDTKTGIASLSSCKMFTNNGTDTGKCEYGYDYDVTWYSLTAPSMQDWVCDNELYVTNTFVASRIGEIIGIFCFGQLGDRIGRRPVYFITLPLLILGRILTVFTSYNHTLFLAAVVLGGSSSVSVFQTPFVIGMEVSAEHRRAQLAFLQCLAWVIGSCSLPMLAWLVGDWQILILITTAPCFLAFFLFKLIPESPRWLASRGRVKDAARVLKHIADINGTQVPLTTIHVLNKMADMKEKTYGIPSLFANARLAKNTLMVLTCWVVDGLSYYSLVLNISNMAGNPFMNFFWQSLVELPGYVIGCYLNNKIGRRWTHTGSYVIAVVFAATVILSHGHAAWMTTLFVSCVKFSFTIAFYTMSLQAMEVFPTCVRQTGVSMGGAVATIFGILGPYVVYLGTTVDSRLPYVILLCLASLGCVCSSALPETLNKKLPETLQDAKNFGASQIYWSFNKTKKPAS